MRRGTIKMGGGVSMRTPLSNRRQAALPLLWEAGFTPNGNSRQGATRDRENFAVVADRAKERAQGAYLLQQVEKMRNGDAAFQ